jgi:ATP-binding protein involved in chromosome partitioning
MPITEQAVIESLRTVNDPDVQRDLVSIGAIRRFVVDADRVELSLAAPGATSEPARTALTVQIESAIRAAAGGDSSIQIAVEFVGSDARAPDATQQAQPPTPAETPQSRASGLPGVSRIIAVGAGKGGVGKSTIAVNLAVGLARQGHAVGLMDGDIYGPSVPTMLGLDSLEPNVVRNMLQPFLVHGVKCITIGKLVEPGKPLIWRGPMAHGAFTQLAEQTEWGELDYLIIDLPPGTGDVILTMAQLLRLDGAVIVCTPQKVAQDDAVRAAAMFKTLGVKVLGVVENMSYFVGDDGKEYDLFGRGGAEHMAQQIGVPFLGSVPINTRLRINSDSGDPTANFESDDQLSSDLNALVNQLENQIALASIAPESATPTVTIH